MVVSCEWTAVSLKAEFTPHLLGTCIRENVMLGERLTACGKLEELKTRLSPTAFLVIPGSL